MGIGPLTSLDATPEDIARNLLWGSVFRDRKSELLKGATIGGQPVLKNGFITQGWHDPHADGLLYDINEQLDGVDPISVQAVVKPSFSVGDSTWHFVFQTTLASRHSIVKSNSNTLILYMGGTAIATVDAVTLAAAWNEYGLNYFTLSATDGDSNLWLNDTKIIDADVTSWSPGTHAKIGVGCNDSIGSGSLWEGVIRMLKFYAAEFTSDDHEALKKMRGLLE
jgi:hypothetical protein